MLRKILLEEKKNKNSINVNNSVNVEIESNAVLLPNDGVSNTVDAYQEYLKEKDASERYRLIFTINPVCTNILFNAVSELVFKEGSDECKLIVKSFPSYRAEIDEMYRKLKDDGKDIGVKEYLEYKNFNGFNKNWCIRDTSFSDTNCGGIVYHCGLDIFNNHMLRKNGFVVVNKLNENTRTPFFNTISDFLRDKDGDIISEKILRKKPSVNGQLDNTSTQLHQYRYDGILNFRRAVSENLVESDGWVGFINPSNMKIDNYVTGETSVCINKCLNNKKAGEFIDMYPDRSLYSFIPKYNKYKKREEYNWDYLITYPYAEDSDTIITTDTRTGERINGLNAKFWDSESGNTIKTEIARIAYVIADDYSGETNHNCFFKTDLSHNLTKDSMVMLSFIYHDTGSHIYRLGETEVPVRVTSVGYNGQDAAHCFSVNLDDILPAILMSFNIRSNTGVTVNMDNISVRVRNVINGCECQYYIRKFKRLPNYSHDVRVEANSEDFNSSLNKLAFAENIFSDKIAQLIFNDDIDTTGIRDNKGRPLTEIYLTLIKTNRGHDLWYKPGENGTNSEIFGNEKVEFSHCFGRVDCGLDLSPDIDNYNVHKINSITPVATFDSGLSGITKDDDFFYGDVVEFSPYTIDEVVLEKVYHRFNTAQREYLSGNTTMNTINYDDIVRDDYDLNAQASYEAHYDINLEINGVTGNTNIAKEGYYYQPHHKILLKELSNTVQQGNDMELLHTSFAAVGLYNFFITLTKRYPLRKGDTVYVYNGKETYTGYVRNAYDNPAVPTQIQIHCDGLDSYSQSSKLFLMNPLKPEGVYSLNDGSGRYLWREILPTSEVIYGDELYDSVFTNGAHYFHKNINFYLRRQDPNGEYGLNDGLNFDGYSGASEGKIKDITYAEYVEQDEGNIC